MENIKFAKDRGFKIELNLVATKLNVGEIEDVFDYVQRMKLVGVKVLTVNDFGDRIKPDNVEQELNALIENCVDQIMKKQVYMFITIKEYI